MNICLNKLKADHPDWYEIISNADHEDIVSYYQLCFAAESNLTRAQDSIISAFPECRRSVADWEAIKMACAELMTDAEINSIANATEQFLTVGGSEEGYLSAVSRYTPKLRTLRAASGLSQRALAEAAHINISQVQRLENGQASCSNLSLKNALAIAEALGVEAKDLI